MSLTIGDNIVLLTHQGSTLQHDDFIRGDLSPPIIPNKKRGVCAEDVSKLIDVEKNK